MDTTKVSLETEPTLYDVLEVMQKGFARIESILAIHTDQFVNMNQEIRGVKRRLFKLEAKFDDISSTIQNHDDRIDTHDKWMEGMGKRGLAGA